MIMFLQRLYHLILCSIQFAICSSSFQQVAQAFYTKTLYFPFPTFLCCTPIDSFLSTSSLPRVVYLPFPPGDKVLCLDGGGIRGLVQLEILKAIEELTHRRIVDLFDWIVGTSTGGILVLGMVYGEHPCK